MKEEANQKTIIIISIAIVLLIGLLSILIATSIINFNKSNNNNNNNDNNSLNNDESNNHKIFGYEYEDTVVNDNDSPEEIVRKLFVNRTVRHVMDNGPSTYCGDSDSKIYGIEGDACLKSNQFKSIEELENHFKTFFTNNYYSKLLADGVRAVSRTRPGPNGTIAYNYHEKDGSLY